MITARNISYRYDRQAKDGFVFRGVSVDVLDGSLIALIGPNGAGKSTLIRCLAGLLHVCEGLIGVDGLSVYGLHPRELARMVSMVSQDTASPFLSVYDTVLAGRFPHSGMIPSKKDELATLEALDAFGLSQLAGSVCSQISGGELQKVLLARSYVQGAKNILLDEPLNGLDFKARHETMRRISTLVRTEGNAALVVMHDLDIAFQYCDGFIALDVDGGISSLMTKGEVTGAVLSDLYGIGCSVRTIGDRTIIETV